MSISLVSEPCAYNLKINERNHWRAGNEVYRSTRLGHVTYIMCLVLRASESATIITVFCGRRSVDSRKNENYVAWRTEMSINHRCLWSTTDVCGRSGRPRIYGRIFDHISRLKSTLVVGRDVGAVFFVSACIQAVIIFFSLWI